MVSKAALKAALLLSRVLVTQTSGNHFHLAQNGVVAIPGSREIIYENEHINVVDMTAGALLLLKGVISDMAEIEEVEPYEIAKLIELSASMVDVVGLAETDPKYRS